MHSNFLILAIAVSALVSAPPVSATEAKSGKPASHGAKQAPQGVKEAEAIGVVNSVDAGARTMNITHEPVAALGWSEMTMDLPVTRRVDLSAVKIGTKIRFRLKQGRDKRFRIIAVGTRE